MFNKFIIDSIPTLDYNSWNFFATQSTQSTQPIPQAFVRLNPKNMFQFKSPNFQFSIPTVNIHVTVSAILLQDWWRPRTHSDYSHTGTSHIGINYSLIIREITHYSCKMQNYLFLTPQQMVVKLSNNYCEFSTVLTLNYICRVQVVILYKL